MAHLDETLGVIRLLHRLEIAFYSRLCQEGWYHETGLAGLRRGLHCCHFIIHRRKNTGDRNELLGESRAGSLNGMVKIKPLRNDDKWRSNGEMKLSSMPSWSSVRLLVLITYNLCSIFCPPSHWIGVGWPVEAVTRFRTSMEIRWRILLFINALSFSRQLPARMPASLLRPNFRAPPISLLSTILLA
jgi:hypothetical protein